MQEKRVGTTIYSVEQHFYEFSKREKCGQVGSHHGGLSKRSTSHCKNPVPPGLPCPVLSIGKLILFDMDSK